MRHQAITHQRSRVPGCIEPDILNSVSIRTFTSKYGSSSTAGIDIPADAIPGDLLIAFIGSNYAVNTAPAGWSILSRTSAGYHNFAILSKTCLVGDAGTTVTAAMSGTEPWNSSCVSLLLGINVSIKSYGTKQTASDVTSLTTPSVAATIGNTVLYGGSARVGSKTTYFNAGTALVTRSADAQLSSTFWYGEALTTTLVGTFTSPSSCKMGCGIVILG